MQSTHTSYFNLLDLPANAHVAHIIPGLVSHSLLSIVTMCNTGCTVTFTNTTWTIIYHGHTIICGHKCTHTSLRMVPLTKDARDQAASPTAPSDHVPQPPRPPLHWPPMLRPHLPPLSMPPKSTSLCAPSHHQHSLGHLTAVKALQHPLPHSNVDQEPSALLHCYR